MNIPAEPFLKGQAQSFAHLQRRMFLARCVQFTAASAIPARCLRADVATPFHFQPQYRELTPLDNAPLLIESGHDKFSAEPWQDAIAALLATWRDGLLLGIPTTVPIQQSLDTSFHGVSWHPTKITERRPAALGLSVHQLAFDSALKLSPEDFVTEMHTSLSDFLQFLTADFQITTIHASPSRISTDVFYELVATGKNFYREQRVGTWTLDWSRTPGSGLRVTSWQAQDEVRSRNQHRSFADITAHAFGSNPCYQAQLLHGADYWRTVLDGACGIDIYGHNGIAAGDFDGDGRDDLYVCQPAGLPNRLFHNRGDGTFQDVTEAAGVGVLENTACALFADFSNSGRQDLLVVRANGPLLFKNQGNGTFRPKPDAFRFANQPAGTFTGAAAADYNRDGLLDLYFCLYVFYQGADQYRYPTPYFAAENGPPNFLMRNNGDGTFSDVTAQSALNRNNNRYSFCCGWNDYNNDGWPDLYVVNDFGLKNLYRNNGDGTFTDVAEDSGLQDAGAGMSVCWFDYDNDGAEDLYVANMWTAAGQRITTDRAFQKDASPQVQSLYRKHAMGNSLFKNSGQSAFTDVTQASGTGLGRWSWSSDSWDFDHDGFADLYVTNGMISGPNRIDLNSFFWRRVVAQSPNTAKPAAEYETGWKTVNELIRADYSWSGYERNIVYANNGNGTFSDVSGAIGLDFLEDGRAFVLADFDGDGRQELLVKNRNAPSLRLLKNTIDGLPPSICFRLRGTKSNRDAIGAVVTITTSKGDQTKTLQAGSGFLSQHSKDLCFGLGSAAGEISAKVRWPSGLRQKFKGLAPGHRVLMTEGAATPQLEAFHSVSLPAAESTSTVEPLPERSETWLLAPIPAPSFAELSNLRAKPSLLCFWAPTVAGADEYLSELEDGYPALRSLGLQVQVWNVGNAPHSAKSLRFPLFGGSADIPSSYSLLFRYLFDRHRDLPVPSAFLVDSTNQIVKIYTGALDIRRVAPDCQDIPASSQDCIRKALPFPGLSATYEFGRNYLSLGSLFFQRGYIESAQIFFQSALQQDPSSAEALYGIGSVYLRQKQDQQARQFFQRAVTAKAGYPETEPNTWNNLGLLYAREGNILEAIESFDRAIRFDPDNLIALKNLGSAYRQQRQWEQAKRMLEHALIVQPADPEANYSLGMIYAQLDQPEQAYVYLTKALAARPAYPEALNNLGILFLRTRRRDDAVNIFQECIRVAPDFDGSYLNLARVYVIEQDPAKARQTLEALLARNPDNRRAKEALAEIH